MIEGKSKGIIPNVSNIARTKEMLLQASEMYKDLAERLSNNGRPLTERERKMIRAAMLPYIQDMMESVMLSFLSGDYIDWERMRQEYEELKG